MSDDRAETIMRIASEALGIEPAQRERYLQAACGGDVALRHDVEALLKSNTPAQRVFDDGAREMSAIPSHIGPYRLLNVIGEGGMGVVWLAEQREPIRRRVALKLIKLGMDTNAVIARFESERQALAMMTHPNVARVLDAGATTTGRPYFVMEYVPGEPITAFCDRHNYTNRQRLELFVQACEAVQHAHHKAIIHRDLKPGNILVMVQDDQAVVKVIDFGIAKATAQKLTERTLFTERGQLVGTPEYMSPEQAENTALDVDTRSDIYSLGVVLYELLSGALPFDARTLRAGGFNEIQRIIREVEPPRPSTRVSSLGAQATAVASRRGTQASELSRQLRGELEWIPLKAMRKDRTQRYATATELAHDVQNYLEQRPLSAGPESASYRLRKLFRRNKGPVIAASLVALALLAGIAGTSIALVGQSRARAEAEGADANSRAINDFLTNDVLGAADPAATRGREVTVREALDAAAGKIAGRFQDRPLTDAAVRNALAKTYHALGRADLGAPHARAALETLTRAFGSEHPDTLTQAVNLVWLLDALGEADEAEATARQALAGLRRSIGDEHPDTIAAVATLCQVLQTRGQFAEAEVLAREAADRSVRVKGLEHQETLYALDSLAGVLKEQGKLSESEPFQRQVLEIARRIYGTDHPDTLLYANNLAILLHSAGKLEEAAVLCRESLDGRARVLGEEHPFTLASMNNMANLDEALGRHHEAEQWHRRALAARRAALGDDHPEALQSMSNLGILLMRQRRFDEADPLLSAALDARRRVLGDDHPHTLISINIRASSYSRQGRPDQGEPLFREGLQRARRALGDGHPQTLTAMNNLADALERQGKLDEAETLFKELLHRSRDAQMDPKQASRHSSRYGLLLFDMQRYAQAEAPLNEALMRLESTGLIGSAEHQKVLRALAAICDHDGRADEAAQWRTRLDAAISSTRPSSRGTIAR